MGLLLLCSFFIDLQITGLFHQFRAASTYEILIPGDHHFKFSIKVRLTYHDDIISYGKSVTCIGGSRGEIQLGVWYRSCDSRSHLML